jgi:hypothetical protein
MLNPARGRWVGGVALAAGGALVSRGLQAVRRAHPAHSAPLSAPLRPWQDEGGVPAFEPARNRNYSQPADGKSEVATRG